jgi:hypothetical protein
VLRVVGRVSYDGRRPWPLGVPSREEALAAIVGHAEVSDELEGSHLRVLTLFPEWAFDEARTALVNDGSQLAWATASAWRAVVALERIEGSMGLDTRGAMALTDELVAARELLVGYSAFALDGGSGSAELLNTIDECIGRFIELSRVEEKAPPVVPTPAPRVTRSRVMKAAPSQPKLKAVAEAPTARSSGFGLRVPLPLLAVVVVVVALGVVFARGRSSADDGWVIKGSLESGQAELVPGGPFATQAQFDARLAELKAEGVTVTRATDGRWVLVRSR